MSTKKPEKLQSKPEKYKYLKIFLIVIGAIFFIFILLLVILFIYLMIAQPFGINPVNIITSPDSDQPAYDHPLLSTEQEQTLESIGVDVSELPTSLTAEQQQCAVDALGQQRVNEIINGASPSTTDFLKAQHCF